MTTNTITIEVPKEITFRNTKADATFKFDITALVKADAIPDMLAFACQRSCSDATGGKVVGKQEAAARVADKLAQWLNGDWTGTGGKSVPSWIAILRETASAKGLVPKGLTDAKAIPVGATDADLGKVFGPDKVERVKAKAMAEAKRREAFDLDDDDVDLPEGDDVAEAA
jgi:hypothetical protein